MNILKEKLRQNFDTLVKGLGEGELKRICDYLYEELVLDGDDLDRIDAERVRSEKVRRFLRIMEFKSEEGNHCFVKKLGEAEVSPHLAEAILNTQIKCQTQKEETPSTGKGRHGCLEKWKTEEVCGWLQSLEVEANVIESFRRQKISGEILSSLKKEEFAEFCPDIPFGDLKKIISNRDEELKRKFIHDEMTSCFASDDVTSGEEVIVSQTFLNFGRMTDRATPVTQDTCFQFDSRPEDSLIDPAHCYVPAKNEDVVEALYEFSKEIIPFICACMNDRTNGTFHLGVGKNGKIHGVNSKEGAFEYLLKELVENSFLVDQLEAVKRCVRPVRLVEVKQKRKKKNEREEEKLWLIEVDVIPAYHVTRTDAFFAKAPKCDSQSRDREHQRAQIFRFQDGEPVPISDKDLVDFMNDLKHLADRRQDEEEELRKAKLRHQTTSLAKKLTKLLCLGGDCLDGNIYPVYVMSSAPCLQSTADDFIENMKFLNSSSPKIIFDFDDGPPSTSVYRNLADKVPILEFVISATDPEGCDKRINETSTSTMLKDCLSNSMCHPWIFCNGYEPKQEKMLDVLEWKRGRKVGFVEAVDCIHRALPRGHVVVVFLLFSDDYDVMLSAAEEFCPRFHERWMVISESEKISKKFREFAIKTARIVKDEKEFDRHSVIGMPWLHVNQTILRITDQLPTGRVNLPTSTGSIVEATVEFLSELEDLEVLGSKYLSNIDDMFTDAEFDKLNLDKEQRFYCGGEVDWWNFWFKDHVMEREILDDVLKHARNMLDLHCIEDDSEEHVGITVIEHQPGAGGTTLAKNVLWKLKEDFRCAILRSYTSATANQVSRLLKYGETQFPRPVLLLVDSFEDGVVRDLKGSLESEIQRLSKEIEHLPDTAVLLLVVSRCFTPTDVPERFLLGHRLSKSEIQWFDKKYREMERQWNENKRENPRFLLSFNILRENFSEDYIQRTVPRLLELVTDPNERELLGYVAFVGVFDPDNTRIPASCFDWLMCQQESRGACDCVWVRRISTHLKILVNDDTKQGAGLRTQGIRVISSLLAKEMHKVLADGRLDSEVCLEFLESGIFRCENIMKEKLYKIVNNVTIKRVKRLDGRCEAEFSPLVQRILSDPSEDKVKAVEILELAFRMTNNVYIAQHLARYYISGKEWDSAEDWARGTTEMEPGKEILWNTYAHVFSDQFHHRFNSASVNFQAVEKSLDLVRKAMELYRTEQQVCDRETRSNPTGLVCEGNTILSLIEVLKRIPNMEEKELRLFLIDDSFVPRCLKTWTKESVGFVKRLQKEAVDILTSLENERYRQDKNAVLGMFESARLRERMIKITESFTTYFGEESNETPAHFSAEEAAGYRRRRIFRLRGNTFSRILELCRDGRVDQLSDIKRLAADNLNIPERNATDLIAFLGASIALFTLSEDVRSGEDVRQLQRLTKLSQELARICSDASNVARPPLETYLFFVLFNWPTSSSSSSSSSDLDMIDAGRLPDILAMWKAAYAAKNEGFDARVQGRRRVLFYLGVGCGMKRIVAEGRRRREVLEMFEGVLINRGREVQFVIRSANEGLTVEILANSQIKYRENKRVSFELGFTWEGPVAMLVPPEDKRRVPIAIGDRSLRMDPGETMDYRLNSQPPSFQRMPHLPRSSITDHNMERARHPPPLLPPPPPRVILYRPRQRSPLVTPMRFLPSGVLLPNVFVGPPYNQNKDPNFETGRQNL